MARSTELEATIAKAQIEVRVWGFALNLILRAGGRGKHETAARGCGNETRNQTYRSKKLGYHLTAAGIAGFEMSDSKRQFPSHGRIHVSVVCNAAAQKLTWTGMVELD